MKNRILVLTIAILMLPIISLAQDDIFKKYSNNADVSYVSIDPQMLQMIVKMGMDLDDPQAKSFIDMVNSITSFKTISTDKTAIIEDIKQYVGLRSGQLNELMVVKEDNSEVDFYAEESSEPGHVKELLIFVKGFLENNNKETMVVSITGDIVLSEVAKLTSKLDIPGGEHLEKK